MQNSNWGDKFSHVAMKDLARFLSTYNMADQTIAADTNVWDIQSNGTGACTINGIYIPSLPVDDVLDISLEQIAPVVTTHSWELLTAAGVTSHAVDDEVYTGTLTSIDQKFYKCLVAHDGVYGTEPANNPNLWQSLPNIDTLALLDDFRLWTMITAEADGTLGVWIASEAVSAIETAPTLKVPYFDPSIYCVVAFGDYRNDEGTTSVQFGDDGGGSIWTQGGDCWFNVVLGPVFPHPDNMPKN